MVSFPLFSVNFKREEVPSRVDKKCLYALKQTEKFIKSELNGNVGNFKIRIQSSPGYSEGLVEYLLIFRTLSEVDTFPAAEIQEAANKIYACLNESFEEGDYFIQWVEVSTQFSNLKKSLNTRSP